MPDRLVHTCILPQLRGPSSVMKENSALEYVALRRPVYRSISQTYLQKYLSDDFKRPYRTSAAP